MAPLLTLAGFFRQMKSRTSLSGVFFVV